ncbi:predicted protein [Uncinocarpus reesii 1704]|uniref:Peptidase A1 domain-containing protein n=1 Tax=Uncinocarpus reesii (strain UAMH 1704) TaxID=336963 RepID=C4JSZ2_UNCRE|nr:uncharacterized protein UREG_05581 [Uncinocarpus reesii 1704]EEP80739.1 predicted protein [Uncinocarpus reesii 1704]
MHFSSWLLCAGILSTTVSAFYPVKLPPSDNPSLPDSSRRRFFPVPLPKAPSQDEKKPLTLDLVRSRRRVRRDNKYSAVMGSDPTMENSAAIHQDGNDYSYFSTVKFGSRGQPMWLLLDTGASESWVMSSNCTAEACLRHNSFGVEDSDTLNVTQIDWNVTYGTGRVEGVIVEDKVSLADFELQLAFGSALNASDDFLSYPMDGILGLGPSTVASVPTLLQLIKEKKLFSKTILGISLQRAGDGATDGQLTFGDVDKSSKKGDGYFNIPCDTALSMEFVFYGAKWTVSPKDYVGTRLPLANMQSPVTHGKIYISWHHFNGETKHRADCVPCSSSKYGQ